MPQYKYWVSALASRFDGCPGSLAIDRSWMEGSENKVETLKLKRDGSVAWEEGFLFAPHQPEDGIPLLPETMRRLACQLWESGYRPPESTRTGELVAQLRAEIKHLRKQLKRAGEPFTVLGSLHSKLMDMQPASSDRESLDAIEEKLEGLGLQVRDYAERNVRRGDNLNESLGEISTAIQRLDAFNGEVRKAFLHSTNRGETIVDQIRDINQRHDGLVKLMTHILQERDPTDGSSEEDPISPGRGDDQGGDSAGPDHPVAG